LTHVLNVSDELPNYFEGKDITYLKIAVRDYETEDITSYFKQAYEFIDNAKNSHMLIHCVLGRSRSFAFLVMFIMKKYKLGFEEANEVVNERRFLGQINLGFEEQLIAFEKNNWEFTDSAPAEQKIEI
jgi:dual specificity phosphatase 12